MCNSGTSLSAEKERNFTMRYIIIAVMTSHTTYRVLISSEIWSSCKADVQGGREEGVWQGELPGDV